MKRKWLRVANVRAASAVSLAVPVVLLAGIAGAGRAGGGSRVGGSPERIGLPQEQEAGPQTPAESESAARYRERAASSGRAIDFYNYGTVLLSDGHVADARAPLRQSTESERERVRESAFYNLGLSAALEGQLARDDQSARRDALLAAREAFRQLLRARPADDDARWNLELVERWLAEERESGGDGQQSGEGESPQGGGSGAAPAASAGESRMMSPEEAAALLDLAGEAEASIRDRVMGRNRFQDPVVEKNW